MGDQGPIEARHYYYSHGEKKLRFRSVKRIIRELGLNARSDKETPHSGVPPIHGTAFQDIYWRRKSYLVILIDYKNGAKKWGLEKLNALTFIPDTTLGYEENHSFFDGRDYEVDLSDRKDGSEMRAAICCINHLTKNDQGDDLSYENNKLGTQGFKLHINFDPPFVETSKAHGRSDVVIMYPDSGGTNMGPPVPPP
jgi:hypothetical protein